MGAINTKCETIYNGVLLSSYIWITISAILFQILNFFVTEYFIPFSKNAWNWLKTKMKPKEEKNLLHLTKVADQRRDEYSAGLSFLWYQILVSYFGFVAACVEEGNSASTFWNTYQNIYGMYINTVALTPIISILFFLARFGVAMLSDRKIKWELDFPEEAEKVLKQMGFLSYLPLVPPIYTHIIPGLFIFAWLPILLLLIFIAYCLVGYLLHYLFVKTFHLQLHKKLVITVVQLGFRICLMILFQSLYNYMYLFYGPAGSYGEVMNLDLEYRTQTTCLFHDKMNSVKDFFSLIIFM